MDPDFASLLQEAGYPHALLVTQLGCDVEVSGPPREVGGEALAETKLLVTQAGLVKLRWSLINSREWHKHQETYLFRRLDFILVDFLLIFALIHSISHDP